MHLKPCLFLPATTIGLISVSQVLCNLLGAWRRASQMPAARCNQSLDQQDRRGPGLGRLCGHTVKAEATHEKRRLFYLRYK